MAQQLQSYGQGPYAEEALRLAEIGRGQEGMSRTAAPVGPNLADSGGMSKPNVNTQPYNNTRLMEQNMQQNIHYDNILKELIMFFSKKISYLKIF